MSGGSLCDYQQYHIRDMWERIQEEIDNNNKPYYENPEDDWEELANKDFFKEGGKRYSDETIAEFKNGVEILKKAYIYAQRIDRLLSGDDGEESFHKRLKEELQQVNYQGNSLSDKYMEKLKNLRESVIFK